MDKMVIGVGVSPDDIVRYYFPEMGEDDVDMLLWDETCYPFGPVERIGDMIWEYYERVRVCG
jgi:hypothetical protein